MDRFPFGIPNSWYLVAYSDELGQDEIRPLPYLGRNMIAIRDADGAVSVLDGYCPHLGADLSVGEPAARRRAERRTTRRSADARTARAAALCQRRTLPQL